MRYLVTAEVPTTAIPGSPDQTISYIENMVIPMHEALIKLEAEKKILAAGCQVGKKAKCRLS